MECSRFEPAPLGNKPFELMYIKSLYLSFNTFFLLISSHFDDLPKNKYSVCKLIAPRPCLTAKYIQCLAADIKSVSHAWVIMSCINNRQMDVDSYILPSGWSIIKKCFINWVSKSLFLFFCVFFFLLN